MSLAPTLISGMSDDEQREVARLIAQVESHSVANFEANAYYEASARLRSPGFTIPADVASRLAPVFGAPGTVVDVLDERLDFTGWDDVGQVGLGLDEVYDDNELDSEAPMAHLDALIYGTSFVRVGRVDDRVLVTMHAPTSTTGRRDPATRRLVSAWSTIESKDGRAVRGVLDLPDVSITVAKRGARWVVEDRDEHNLGRVAVVQLTNRPRGSRPGGRSEITKAIRSLTEDMMRAALGMNVNTMFYSIPQLMVLGRGKDAFVDRNGNPVSGWRILAGHALAIDKDEDGDRPDVKQLTMASPTPFIEQLREFRMQVASEAGMPADYLGIQTSNPSSADAIRAGEARLVKRAERRQAAFGRAWLEVARLAVLMRDGSIPDDFGSRVSVDWLPAATPTRAATADEVAKLVGAGILAPDSAVVTKRLGLSRSEERILEQERRRAAGAGVLAELRAAARSAPLTPPSDVVGG